MREMEEDAAKNSILLYDKDEVSNVTGLQDQVEALCQCQVDHLKAIHGFILHYENMTHIPAEQFLSIKGVVLTDEDHIIMPPNDEIKDSLDEESRVQEVCTPKYLKHNLIINVTIGHIPG